ncbi:MAG: ribosome-associated protein [Chitinophagales bacterium]
MKKKDKNNSAELKKVVIQAILAKKGLEVIELDLTNLNDAVADYFIVCHGTNSTQVAAIADSVYKEVKDELALFPKGLEGKAIAEWIILDYFDVVVHVFFNETREYYQLEELWSDAVSVEHE